MDLNFSNKKIHEEFVSGNNGSSPLDIYFSIFPAVFGSFIIGFDDQNVQYNVLYLFQEFIWIVVPLILSFTIGNQVLLETNLTMIFLLLLKVFMKRILVNSSGYKIAPVCSQSVISKSFTSTRAMVLLSTVVAILAIDFHVFPRRFAKTDSFGYSLMDVGAACFLLMNGITDCRKKFLNLKMLRDIVIIIFLGFVRLITVKASGYQHVISEYGVHANFFFTLAAVKIFCVWWLPKLLFKTKIFFCFGLISANEIWLNKVGYKWLSSDTYRETFIEQNREWFVSLLGNISIYVFGMLIGNVLFHFKGLIGRIRLWCIPMISFALVQILSHFCSSEPSRKFANTSFLLWIVCFFTTVLCTYETFEKYFPPCSLFGLINSHPLHCFLVGNLYTGIINLSIDTMSVGTFPAVLIVTLYAFAVCFTIYLFDNFISKR